VLGEKGAHPLLRVGGSRPVVIGSVAESVTTSCGSRVVKPVMSAGVDGEEDWTTHLLKPLRGVGATPGRRPVIRFPEEE
jgi:hypothetical protein